MKIAFISGVIFGYDLLEELLKNNVQISIVFSYDKSKRKSNSDYKSFEKLCLKNDIIHIKVQNINDEQNIKKLKSIKPDIILVMGWSQLLKEKILKIPKYGVIGSHPTELPKYRGRAPIPWTIIKRIKESALSFFYIKDGVDNGDLVLQKKFKVNSDDNATTLYKKIIELGKQMIIEILEQVQEGNVKQIKQKESEFLEYWPKRIPNDGKINWKCSAKDIHNLIRASTHPYPGAFTFFNNQKLEIWESDINENENFSPSIILDIIPQGVKVGTQKGTILIKKLGINGKEEFHPKKIFSKEDIGKSFGFGSKKIGCIIQARTASSRLPNKILMKIRNKSILEHIISFLKFSKVIDEIIIATSDLPQDDIIEQIAIENNVSIFRGSENDVLSRYYFCAKKFNVDIIVRITADNPLIDPMLVDKIINEFNQGDFDYISNMISQTFPLGYLVEAFTFQILEKLHYSLDDLESREHVTPYLRKNPKKFKTKNIVASKGLERNQWRLTLDYNEDLKLLKIIFGNIYHPGNYIPYESVVKFLDSNKSFLKINQNLKY